MSRDELQGLVEQLNLQRPRTAGEVLWLRDVLGREEAAILAVEREERVRADGSVGIADPGYDSQVLPDV